MMMHVRSNCRWRACRATFVPVPELTRSTRNPLQYQVTEKTDNLIARSLRGAQRRSNPSELRTGLPQSPRLLRNDRQFASVFMRSEPKVDPASHESVPLDSAPSELALMAALCGQASTANPVP